MPHLELVGKQLWLNHGHCIAHSFSAQVESAVRRLVRAVAEHLTAPQGWIMIQGLMIGLCMSLNT